MSINMLEFFCESEAPHPCLSAGRHPVRTGQARRGFTDSRDFRSTELTTKSSLGENAVAGKSRLSGTAYWVFEI